MKRHRGGPHGDGVMLGGSRSVIEAQAAVKDIDSGSYCEECGAWRGQLGLEPTPFEFVRHLVEIMREVRRVLRPDGTLWLNLGDGYVGNAGGYSESGSRGATSSKRISSRTMSAVLKGRQRRPGPGLKAKDMVGIPWSVAFALRDDGWYLRQEVIWHKPNPMPEAVTDRPTKAHEQLFLFSRNPSYCYDAAAIKEPASGTAHSRGAGVNPKAGKNEHSGDRRKEGFNQRWKTKQNASFSAAVSDLVDERNKRSVWTIPTQPTPDLHFASFPEKLVEPCILAGCPRGGVVLDPFGGSGTVGRVAEDLGRKWLLFDLSPDYAEIAKRKTAQIGLLGRVASS